MNTHFPNQPCKTALSNYSSSYLGRKSLDDFRNHNTSNKFGSYSVCRAVITNPPPAVQSVASSQNSADVVLGNRAVKQVKPCLAKSLVTGATFTVAILSSLFSICMHIGFLAFKLENMPSSPYSTASAEANMLSTEANPDMVSKAEYNSIVRELILAFTIGFFTSVYSTYRNAGNLMKFLQRRQ